MDERKSKQAMVLSPLVDEYKARAAFTQAVID